MSSLTTRFSHGHDELTAYCIAEEMRKADIAEMESAESNDFADSGAIVHLSKIPRISNPLPSDFPSKSVCFKFIHGKLVHRNKT